MTRARIWGATVFVDYASRWVKVHLMQDAAHRRPWRHKSSTTPTGGVLRSADITKPGQRVGTDQIVWAQPGLVPKEKGQMTRARIRGATVFVYYASCWVKLHLIQDATGDSTL